MSETRSIAALALCVAVLASGCSRIDRDVEYAMQEFCAWKWPDDERMQDRCVRDQEHQYRRYDKLLSDREKGRGPFDDNPNVGLAVGAVYARCLLYAGSDDRPQGTTDWHDVMRCVDTHTRRVVAMAEGGVNPMDEYDFESVR